jgi:hypothetical protein
MIPKRYVQYRNDPNGTKWELIGSSYNDTPTNTDWLVKAIHTDSHGHYVPKSDYIPCPPPERWTDVTEGLHHTGNWPSQKYSESNGIADGKDYMLWTPTEHSKGYRLRKVQLSGCPQWAFIIEKRED